MAASVSARGARRFTTPEGSTGNNTTTATKNKNNYMTLNVSSNKSSPYSASCRAVQAAVTVQRAFRSTLQVPRRHDTVPPHACVNDALETDVSVLGKNDTITPNFDCSRRMPLSQAQHCFGIPQRKRFDTTSAHNQTIQPTLTPTRCCPTNPPSTRHGWEISATEIT